MAAWPSSGIRQFKPSMCCSKYLMSAGQLTISTCQMSQWARCMSAMQASSTALTNLTRRHSGELPEPGPHLTQLLYVPFVSPGTSDTGSILRRLLMLCPCMRNLRTSSCLQTVDNADDNGCAPKYPNLLHVNWSDRAPFMVHHIDGRLLLSYDFVRCTSSVYSVVFVLLGPRTA